MSVPRCAMVVALWACAAACVLAQQGPPPAGHCEPRWRRELAQCPELELKLDPEQACSCTNSVMEICADFLFDRPGRALWIDDRGCGEPRPDEAATTEKRWTWKVEDLNVEPASGEGRCARFFLKEPGLGYIEFRVESRCRDFPQCDATKTIRKPISAHALELKVPKPYLGIDMTDPLGHKRDSMKIETLFAPAQACRSYEWELVDSVAALTAPSDPDGAWVTVTEQGIPSGRYQQDEIRVTRECEDRKRFTVVRVDVNVGLPEDEEEGKGRLIRLNDNDSDDSGVPDLLEAPLRSSDPDLYPVTIQIWPADLPTGEVVRIFSSLPLYEDTRKQDRAAAAYPVSRLPLTLYAEGAAAGDGQVVQVRHGGSPAIDRAAFRVYSLGMVPDADRNRRIMDDDKAKMLTNAPFRFWVNDDNDNGDIAEGDSDVPGQGDAADHRNGAVDGRCDLTDFFPVWLDLHDMISLLQEDLGVEFRLSQADGAVKIVYTDLSRGEAGNYMIADTSHCGPSMLQSAHEAATVQVTPEGIVLNENFLSRIAQDRNKGVLMVEATRPSTAPLVLTIRAEGHTLCTLSLALSLSGVEDMYRWINVRAAAGGSVSRSTDTSEPDNYPDSLCNGKQFIFVHGYSVSEDGARAWNAEMFKRLYQSGSRAMFTAVAWRGNDGQLADWIPFIGGSTPDYYVNVEHAFETASNLVTALSRLPGTKYIAGHSLGNMVVSSAIKDAGLSVSAYFMLNAAVATEAYDDTFINRDDMRHPDWKNYSNRLWASEWYQLFPSGDGRNDLSWRDRFGGISVAYDYYSSTEDVLNNANGSVPSIGTERAWVCQEMRKGTTLIWLGPGNAEAGWGFNGDYSGLTVEQANALSNSVLQTNSFFLHFDDDALYGTNGKAVAEAPAMNRQLLADAVPALSNPAGRNSITSAAGQGNRDFMSHGGGAGLRRGIYANGDWPTDDNRWHHSDLKEVAYPYNSKAFDQIVNDGSLK